MSSSHPVYNKSIGIVVTPINIMGPSNHLSSDYGLDEESNI